VPDREQLPGAPEARLDLVGDQQDPVLPGDLAQARQEGRRRDDVATLAEHGLDDDRGHPLRVHHLVEEQVELRLPVAGARGRVVGAARRAVAVGIGGVVHRPGEGLEGGPVHVLGGRERHRLGGPPVVPISERDEDRAAGRDARELHGRFDRLSAAVREEGLPRSAREDMAEALVQPEPRLVVDDVLLAVEELRGLGLDRGHDSRVRVARVRDADPRAVVEIAIAVGGDEPAALAVVDDDVRDATPDRGDDRGIRERPRDRAGDRVRHRGLQARRWVGC
jgi:hypothetical protein